MPAGEFGPQDEIISHDWKSSECTSDDPTDHQGDTCPVHEDPLVITVRPSVHNIEDVKEQAASYAGHASATASEFMEKVLEESDGNLQISGNALAEIVLAWPSGCNSGKRDFLASLEAVFEEPNLGRALIFKPEIKFEESNGRVTVDWGDSLDSAYTSSGDEIDIDSDMDVVTNRFFHILIPDGRSSYDPSEAAARLRRLADYMEAQQA